MKVKKLEKQLTDLNEQLTTIAGKRKKFEKEAAGLIYAVRVEGSQEAKTLLQEARFQIDQLNGESADLKVALVEAEKRLAAAKAKQAAAEREAKMTDLKAATDRWLEKSASCNKLIDKLAAEIEQYQDARSVVFAAATSLGGRQIGLERKSTVANYVHLRLSRIYPHDFIWVTEHLRRHGGVQGMDKEIAGALVSGTDAESLRRLQDGLEANLKDKLIERETMAVS